jgi:hypothetical protein
MTRSRFFASFATPLTQSVTAAAQPEKQATPSFHQDAGVPTLAEAITAATGKRFILDPRNRMMRSIRRIAEVADDAPTIVPDPAEHPEQPAADEHLTRVAPVREMAVGQLEAMLRRMQQLDQNRGQTDRMPGCATEAHVTVRRSNGPQDSRFHLAQVAEEPQAVAGPREAYPAEPGLLR